MPPPVTSATTLPKRPVMLFSRRLFSLPRKELWWIFAVHCVRLISGSLFIALAWHAAMPTVSLTMWLFLAAARLLAWRLPLVPNKELVFATFAIMLIGEGESLSDLMALIAAMSLLTHVVLIVAVLVNNLVRKKAQEAR